MPFCLKNNNILSFVHDCGQTCGEISSVNPGIRTKRISGGNIPAASKNLECKQIEDENVTYKRKFSWRSRHGAKMDCKKDVLSHHRHRLEYLVRPSHLSNLRFSLESPRCVWDSNTSLSGTRNFTSRLRGEVFSHLTKPPVEDILFTVDSCTLCLTRLAWQESECELLSRM